MNWPVLQARIAMHPRFAPEFSLHTNNSDMAKIVKFCRGLDQVLFTVKAAALCSPQGLHVRRRWVDRVGCLWKETDPLSIRQSGRLDYVLENKYADFLIYYERKDRLMHG